MGITHLNPEGAMVRASRWLVVPVVATLAAAPLQRADAQLVSFGVMAGANMSTLTGDFSTDLKNNTGFIAGAFVRIGALGFAVQPGAYYTVKGAKSSDFSDDAGSKTSLDYLEVPLILRIGLPMHLYVGAGPAVGIKLGCKITEQAVDAGASQDCKDVVDGPDFKSTEVSGIAEAGIEFRHWSLGARADLGISNVQEAVNGGGAGDLNVKTRTLSAVLAIRF